MEGVELEFEEDALLAVTKKAITKGTGGPCITLNSRGNYDRYYVQASIKRKRIQVRYH